MLDAETRKRENDLKDILRDLSNEAIDDSKCEEITKRFTKIYRDGFRHRYSSFHPLLQEIMASSKVDQGVSEFLIVNLNTISAYIEEQYITYGQCEHTKLYHPIFKLCDHINLELARINEQKLQEHRLGSLRTQIEEAQHKLEDTEAKVEKAQKKGEARANRYTCYFKYFLSGYFGVYGWNDFFRRCYE